MDIQELRRQINTIDEQLVKLFDERMKVALEIAKYKKAHQLPVVDSAREQEVLLRQTEAVDEEMAVYVRLLYNTLFGLSKSYQQRWLICSAEMTECVAKALESFPDACKLSFRLKVQHRPDALHALLVRFAALGLNLSKLEIIPIAGTDDECLCYVELEASVQDENARQLLAQLEEEAEEFALLGSYSEN